MARDEIMIAALKRERAGYVSRGETERVRQVDESLKRYGYEGTQDADPNTPVVPEGRTAAAGQRTAEGDATSTKPEGTGGSADEKSGAETKADKDAPLAKAAGGKAAGK